MGIFTVTKVSSHSQHHLWFIFSALTRSRQQQQQGSSRTYLHVGIRVD